MNRARILVVGWDGADWDLARPWMEAGDLPALARIVEEGIHSPLRSTVPPATFPAWSTFLTGANPGRHGIFDFTERLPGRYAVRLVNARSRRAPTVLRRLSDTGRRVASVAVPVTWPPEQVNGAIISGFDAPGVGSKADESCVWPKGLLAEVRREVGPYTIASDAAPLVRAGKHEEALDRVLQTVDRKGRTALYLLEKGGWDLFLLLFGESDLVGHHFWRFHDPASPFHEEASPRLKGAIREVYQRLDRWTGELRAAAGEDSTVVVLSDHGFGGAGRRTVRLNAWLAEQGHLAFRSGGLGRAVRERPAAMAKAAGLRLLPKRLRQLLIRGKGNLAGAVESKLRFAPLEMGATRAYSEETPHFPAIWLNVRGRDPDGCVEPGGEYEELRETLIRELRGWTDPESGRPVVAGAWKREELYRGAETEKAPDIVLDWALDADGHTPQCARSRKAGEPALSLADPRDPDLLLNKSGSHRPHGILAAAGPGVLAGAGLSDPGLEDLVPTFLSMLGQPVPEELDGRALSEGFAAASGEAPAAPGEAPGAPDQDSGYTEEEEAIIAERLRGLGYLE